MRPTRPGGSSWAQVVDGASNASMASSSQRDKVTALLFMRLPTRRVPSGPTAGGVKRCFAQRAAASVVAGRVELREQDARVAKPGEVGHARGVQAADEVVALVLHDA